MGWGILELHTLGYVLLVLVINNPIMNYTIHEWIMNGFMNGFTFMGSTNLKLICGQNRTHSRESVCRDCSL